MEKCIVDGTSKEIDAEEYDLKRSGASADLIQQI